MHLSSLADVEDAIRTADAKTRHQTLRAVTDLFFASAPDIDEEKAGLFDEVFEALVVDDDPSAMAHVSQRLASLENSPPKLIKRLANHDAIEVAAPVLQQSPRLSVQELEAIALSKGNGHLLAISKRPTLAAPVTDVLIRRGNRDVALNVAANPRAALSELGIRDLMRRASTDHGLGTHLKGRGDLPQHFLKEVATRTQTGSLPRLQRIGLAQRNVAALQQSKQLNDAGIRGFATSDQCEEAIAAIALLSGMKYGAVEDLLIQQNAAGFILVCKGIGLSWGTVSAVFQCGPDSRRLSATQTDELQGEFLKITRATAERVLRFWRARSNLHRD